MNGVPSPNSKPGKGDRHLLPERPGGCFAQKVPVTFSQPRRGGMALLVVLLLLSLTLGLSYAAMRSQSTELKILSNSGRRVSARQAALTGLAVALKKMHLSEEWDGVGSTLTGELSDYENYQVTYTTGDPSYRVPATIDWENPDFDDPYYDFPYRVTLLSTGYAADPDTPASIATYQVRAVVRLVPRALADEHEDWPEMSTYTLYQWKDGDFKIDVPLRIEGSARIQKAIKLGEDYGWKDRVKTQYLGDLGELYAAEIVDWRPFTGPLDLSYDNQGPKVMGLLQTSLQVPTNDVKKREVPDWNHLGVPSTYQIYPGGKVYDARMLVQNHADKTLQPNPTTNPLGIFCRIGQVLLYDNVTVRGTLVTGKGPEPDIHIFGHNVHLRPCYLPPVEGTDKMVSLPVGIVEDDIRIHPGAGGSLSGMLLAWGDFEVQSDLQYDINLQMQCRIVAKQFLFRGRTDWARWNGWWDILCDEFERQLAWNEGRLLGYFPVWLDWSIGLDPDPRLRIKPDPRPTRYHCQIGKNPIFVPHPDDDGLRWEVLEWTENP